MRRYARMLTEFMIDKAMRLIARGMAAGRLTTVAEGLNYIPATGPALIAARHYHHLFDGLAFFHALPRRFHILVTLDWVGSRWSRWFMETVTSLARWPVLLRGDAMVNAPSTPHGQEFSRSDLIRYQRRAIRDSIRLLCEERLLVVFPEGYPNIDPTYTPKSGPAHFLPFKPGMITIARAAETRLGQPLPIIPAGFAYSGKNPVTAHVSFGAPVFRRDFPNDVDVLKFLELQVTNLSRIADGNTSNVASGSI